MIAVVAHGPSPLWYATRGAGATTLVLLTAGLVLGIGEFARWRPAGASRYSIAALHRAVSLFALALLAVHVATTLLDPFPPIGVVNAVVPFVSGYRPLWLGLGTLAADMLLALVVTSLVRRRLGYRSWRALHWLAYACWPVALLHGLGTGSDAASTWMLALAASCTAAVLVALGGRLLAPSVPAQARGGLAAGAAAALLVLAVWMAQGPLARGWARRAGTPQSVLAAFSPRPAAVRAGSRGPAPDALAKPFAAALAGTVHNGVSAGGVDVIDLSMRLAGGPPGVLRVRLGGQALPGGGLHVDRSAVTFGPPGDPARYRGRIGYLDDSRLRALVGASAGPAVQLSVDLQLAGATVGGRVRGEPVRRTGA
jgi:DMSO/TMAO reductase YedYZ heme-binding membrane subunit